MTDKPASFKSILAGVQRLRESHGPGDASSGATLPPEPVPEPKRPDPLSGSANVTPVPVINAFNQQKTDAAAGKELSQIEERKRKWGDVSKGPSGISVHGKTVLVSASQRGNPLLSSMTNTSWRYISPTGGNKVHYDYCVQGRNVVFLSLKYHKLHPEYISKKIQPLIKSKNNVMICVVDVESSENILKDLNKACMFNGFALLLAFNFEQAAKYIVFMNK
ncbi:LANO_0B08394g1_1 [Lachancea nothofagi CBS 11611]|uniref:LANO_0B08394g1_1 n=1 Tax=Lachancea nothofagi CBS 11611 TaxID=1266666 RepID=A0A1G4J109_9SACH|nr:LANO_0B08394g1_1 [Lachancea nothofagi CBS 11611]